MSSPPPPAPQPTTQGASTAASPGIPPPTSPPPPTADPQDDDQDQDRPASPDLPLTMTASLVLTQLPRDAAAALAEAEAALSLPEGSKQNKVIVRFKPVGGSAPPLPPRRERSTISAASRFEVVVAYLRRTLRVSEGESLFLYVNSTFAPALDEVVGNLWRCFKDSNDQLNVGYSMTPAFG